MQSHDDSHIEIAQFVLECNSFIPDHASCISRPSSVIRNRDRNCARGLGLGARGSFPSCGHRGSGFGVQFAVRGSGFAVRGSRLGARGSRLGARARGSRLGVFRSANDFRLPPPDSPIHPFTHSPIHRPTQRGKRGCRRSGPVPPGPVRRRGLTQPGGPLPQSVDGGRREAVAQRPGRDDELLPVVRLVGQGVAAEEDRVAGHGAVDERALHAGKRAAVCQPRVQQRSTASALRARAARTSAGAAAARFTWQGTAIPTPSRTVQPEAAAVVGWAAMLRTVRRALAIPAARGPRGVAPQGTR